MPYPPKTICTEPMCRQYAIPKGRGKCDTHKKQDCGWTKRAPEAVRKRMSGSKWEVTRQRIMRRDAYLCQMCLANGKYTQGQEVDHKIEVADGGGDEDNNLQFLCKECHHEKTQEHANIRVRRILDLQREEYKKP